MGIKEPKVELISILMPTYNVEKFVKEAVESILNQTWANFELIIVDDCSSDKTYEILSSLAQKDSRIQLYRNEQNSKICKTLNRALSYTRGKYIARMDGDDISTPDRLGKLYQYLNDHPEIDLIGSNVITIDENGKEIGRKSYIYSDKGIKLGNRFMPCIAHIWLARRKVYDQLSGYRDIPYAEDFDFLLRGELLGFTYANVKDYLYYVRIRNGNTGSSNGLIQRKTADYVKKLHRLESKSRKNEFNKEQYEKAVYCTEDEKSRYIKAAMILNQAIMNKKYPLKMLIYAIKAACETKYIFRYLLDAIAIRAIKKMGI